MSQKAITINTPASSAAHITAEDDAFIYDSIFAGASGILGQLTCTKINDNSVRLSNGGVSNKGYIARIPADGPETLTVTGGSYGASRCDLVVSEFTKGSAATADSHVFKIITGTAGSTNPPSLTTSDLLYSGDVNQIELFRIVLNGTEIESVTKTAPDLPAAQNSREIVGRSFFSGASEPSGAQNGDVWFVTE